MCTRMDITYPLISNWCNKLSDSIFYIWPPTACRFPFLHFPFCLITEQTDNKVQVLPPLTPVGEFKSFRPWPTCRNLLPGTTVNHNKNQAICPFIEATWTSLNACSCSPRKPQDTSHEYLHTHLVYVWYHQSWQRDPILEGGGWFHPLLWATTKTTYSVSRVFSIITIIT